MRSKQNSASFFRVNRAKASGGRCSQELALYRQRGDYENKTLSLLKSVSLITDPGASFNASHSPKRLEQMMLRVRRQDCYMAGWGRAGGDTDLSSPSSVGLLLLRSPAETPPHCPAPTPILVHLFRGSKRLHGHLHCCTGHQPQCLLFH